MLPARSGWILLGAIQTTLTYRIVTRITGILFDKDGTLLDFNRTWIPPYLQAAAFLSERGQFRLSA